MNYAHPEVLVDTQWVAEHLSDRKVRVIQTDMDMTAYNSGHIPGAVFWNAFTTFMQPDYRFNFEYKAFSELLARSGIANDTTVIIYSDHNAGANCAFWFLKVFGHNDVRVMNGGRKKWLLEKRSISTEIPTITPTIYTLKNFDISIRAMQEQVKAAINTKSALVDVRTHQEYCGELFMMKPPEKNERAGHIKSAIHLFYELALNEDDTFKSAEELYALYSSKGITPNKEVITYCAFGARSSHTWFVLKYLLGYENVRNYDGSWNEWSRLPDTQVET
ncbi:sulfurtransferase [Plectonema radiosum NIES-515]|uniref:Sulfurtransferase n=1 Tax=Plectonema radiosum NIES-515 TaxID=2986073 RepID=A0ABT3B4Y6_9CYAN|nr:sulfurtransferase [Plectonema radiosum]MCV3216448.1 sulfurtransferase [Plectonema radiosum NIES-515]